MIISKIIKLFKQEKSLNEKNEGIVNLPLLEDGRKTPERVEDFKEWHCKALRMLNKHPVKEPFTGLISQEVCFDEFIPMLLHNELLDTFYYDEALPYLKNDNLKSILKHFGLKISGSKKELVERILHNISESEVRELEEYSDYYILTEKGKQVLADAYARTENEKLVFFKKAVDLIMESRIDEAYRMICKGNAEKPVPPGMGSDWKRRYYEGLNSSEIESYKYKLKENSDRLMMAATIYEFMSGDALRTIQFNLQHAYGIEANIVDDLRHESSNFLTDKNFTSYEECGIEKYQFLGTLDLRTCSTCSKLDGKIFLVRDRKTGINCPPMHKGCRCTTISVVDEKYISQMKRSARDPVTGKAVEVPRTMNYQEWYDTYVRNNPEALTKCRI